MGNHLVSSPSLSSQPAIYEPSQEAEKLRELAYAGRLFSGLVTHWRLFCSIFGGFVALVVLTTLVIPKQYTATAKMIVGGTQSEADAIGRQCADTAPL